MSTLPTSSRANDAQRRSQRVLLKVAVLVLAHGADKKQVSEKTRTVTVNAHGAMILLSYEGFYRTSTLASKFRDWGGSVLPSGVCQPS